jgi:hypothetical protein
MSKFPTSREDLALDIVFELMGESRYNRTHEEYMAIAAQLPPLKRLHGLINDRLAEMNSEAIDASTDNATDATTDIATDGTTEKVIDALRGKVCHFKPGDKYVWYEDFPRSLSLETVRSALTKIGMREPGYRRKP